MHAVVRAAQAQPEHVVAVTEPPAIRGAAEIEVQLAADERGGGVVVAGVADRAGQALAARAVDAVVVQREALAVADQEVQSRTRHALAIAEAEVLLQVEIAVVLVALVTGADGGVGMRVIAAQPDADAIERGRLLGTGQAAGQRQREEAGAAQRMPVPADRGVDHLPCLRVVDECRGDRHSRGHPVIPAGMVRTARVQAPCMVVAARSRRTIESGKESGRFCRHAPRPQVGACGRS